MAQAITPKLTPAMITALLTPQSQSGRRWFDSVGWHTEGQPQDAPERFPNSNGSFYGRKGTPRRYMIAEQEVIAYTPKKVVGGTT